VILLGRLDSARSDLPLALLAFGFTRNLNMIARRLFAFSLGLFACCGIAFAQSADTTEYVLGAGDLIKVSVYQVPDLSAEVRISETGQITFPLLGNVTVAGSTVTGVQEKIAKALRDGGFVLKPQVIVSILQVKSSQVSILGQISKPGRYPIETTTTKVSEIIALAGGILPTGSDVVTLVGTRNDKSVRLEIDVPAILQFGKSELDINVVNGDIIYVAVAPTAYMYGEVQRPGVFPLTRGMSVLQALAQAGGLTPKGTERGMRVHRRDAKGVVQVLDIKMSDLVESGDVINVRESVF
jgi:polysaccharide export outer membrane protein